MIFDDFQLVIKTCLKKTFFFVSYCSPLTCIFVFRNCPSTFDETMMFTGDPVTSRGLKVA